MSLLGPQLEAFMAIVHCKTVHAAATQIHITQTAVTQRIRALETKLKTTLFIRTHRGMLPTQEALALIRYCQSVQLLEGEALAAISGSAKQSEITLSISGPSSIMMSRIIPRCIPILKKFPKLYIDFQINDAEERHHQLKTGAVDFAIVQPEDAAASMETKKLKSEQYILVGPPAWKNRKIKEIVSIENIIDFNPLDQITYLYLKQYDLFQYAKKTRHFANRTEMLALMVSQGLGFTALVKEFAAPYLDDHQLIALNQSKPYEHDYVLAWYTRPEHSNYFQAILDVIG